MKSSSVVNKLKRLDGDLPALSVVSWNIDGLHSKISDGDSKSYISSFDIAVLVETFVEDSYNLAHHFPEHDKYACSAVKLSQQGRRSGGVIVLVHRRLRDHLQQIETVFDQLIVLKFDKQIFQTTCDVILIAAYIPPQGSAYYENADTNCHIESLDSCIMYIREMWHDSHLILLGDMNARTGRFQASVDEDYSLQITDPLCKNSPICENRNSQDIVLNDFGKILLDLCICYDLHIHNGIEEGDREGRYTYVSGHGNSVVDYCITSKEFSNKVKHFSVAQRVESVHMPLELVLDVSQNDYLVEQPMLTWENFVWQDDKVEQFLQTLISDTSISSIREALSLVDTDVNSAVDLFCECLLNAGQCMKKSYKSKQNKHYSDWFDRECRDSKKVTTRALRRYRNTQSDQDKEAYLDQRKQYKALLKNKEAAFRAERIHRIEQSIAEPIQFWKEVRKCRRKQTVNNNISNESWFNHFSSLLNLNVEVDDVTEQNVETESHFDETLDSDITLQEVCSALHKLKCRKAAGPDQVINEFLLASEQLVMPFLVKLFNCIFKKGIFPEKWTKSIIVPLHKKGDLNDPNNYRGISLLSCVGKIFTGVLNQRLMKWAEENTAITEAQAGFRRGRSTIDHIFTLHAIIEKQFANNTKLYVAFVDFYKAFDSVSHATLWSVLSRTGIRGRMLNALRGMYASVKSCVRCAGGELTDYFNCIQGLKQGCLCSPILFSYFINELATDIEKSGKHGVQLLPNQIELFHLLFADDLALMSKTVTGLQNQLNLLHQSTQRLGLKINTDKTKIVVFRKGGHLGVREVWHIGGEKIEVVGKYKYLGLTFSTMISTNIATDDFVSRAKRGIVQIASALRSYGCFSCKIFFKLFDTQILPSVLYASELWGWKENKKIEKVHLYACKLFINVPARTPNDMIYGELGRFPLFIEAAARCVHYWLKVLKQDNTRYSKMAYMSLFNLHEKGHINWVTQVKSLLCNCGFGLVWLFGGVTDEKSFLNEFRERLKADFELNWYQHVQESTRFSVYHSFKSLIGREPYLDTIRVSVYRTALARFRMGVSPFNAHKYYFALDASCRMCPFCPGCIEDETHVITNCSAYEVIRDRYVQIDVQQDLRNQTINMIKTIDEGKMVNLAKFLYLAWKIRLVKLTE